MSALIKIICRDLMRHGRVLPFLLQLQSGVVRLMVDHLINGVCKLGSFAQISVVFVACDDLSQRAIGDQLLHNFEYSPRFLLLLCNGFPALFVFVQ